MTCYLCTTPMGFLFHKRGYDIWRCPSCGLGMTDFTLPYRSFLPTFYSKGYFTGNDACGAYTDYGRDKQFVVRNIQKIFSNLPKPQSYEKLLDVGCAMGYLVEEALRGGWDAYGVDVSDYAISQAAKAIRKRLTVSSFEDVHYKKQSFDCITMLDVVEHLKDPRENLQKLHTLLSDNGTLVVSTGNTNSFFARIMERHWTFYTPPQHLYFFTKETLTTLLEEAGFEPVRSFGIGKWLSLGYVLHLAATSADFPIVNVVKELAQKIHIDSIPIYLSLGDNMVVIAKKK